MREIILPFFIIVYLCIINTVIVSACSCAPLPSPQESLEKSTAVFAGKVTGIDIPNRIIISSADPVSVTFNVSEIWKGPDYKTLVVTTAREEAQGLGKGNLPANPGSNINVYQTSDFIQIFVLVLGVIILIAIIMVVRKYKK